MTAKKRFGFTTIAMACAVAVLMLSGAYAEKKLIGGVETTEYQYQPQMQYVDNSPGIVGLDMSVSPSGIRPPLIRDVYRYSPAHQVGIRPGDQLLAIDGDSTMGKSRAQIDLAISDVPGTVVTLTIKRGAHVKNMEVRVASLAEVHPSLRALFVSSNY